MKRYMMMLGLATLLTFSRLDASLAKDSDVSSTVKADTVVTIAAGNQAKTITRLGAIDSKSGKPRHIVIEIGRLLQKNVGDRVSSCLQWPAEDTPCQ